MTDWWLTPDVTGWPATEGEQRGLRPKLWIVDPNGQHWLRKEALRWRPTELAIEAFTLELARHCGIDAAIGRCCTWIVHEKTVRGFISRKFHDDTEEQSTGGELLASELQLPADLSEREVERRRRILTTLPLTRQVLEAQQARYQADLIRPFLRMLVFDAWIGNGDRHSANWAILVSNALKQPACRLAPTPRSVGTSLGARRDSETVSPGPEFSIRR